MSAPPPQQQHQEVDRATVSWAVATLFKWMCARAADSPPNLLTNERDDLLLLQVSLCRIPTSPSTKPRLLPLPHPVLPGESACVISDDRPKSRSPAPSDLLDASRSHHLPVSEVNPLSTLRTDYRPYESRCRLAASHDLFIADRVVLPLLPRVLGKAFYSTKKAPIAVDFNRPRWPEQVRKVMNSTFLYLRSGTCSGIKVGRLDMKEEDIVHNNVGKKKTLKYVEDHGGEEDVKESGKRKRNKKQQANDGEEAVKESCKKRKKAKGTFAELKISKKGKEKSKRALDKMGEDASVKKKKGRKNDHALEEASNKKKKGKKEASNKKEVIGGGGE
ncbi:hypothetical protein E2562_031060 [Oryza meyeriana var. granulata]|uniref:Uncharacterized protein n=1 Tax=Oryza meyeriana var. granulata TaxID=110450 RepID=A0A6G1E3P4_9ORYZ|nr:hypothetical protein E2562_031060 [Oryza meyeriana var. granulata]